MSEGHASCADAAAPCRAELITLRCSQAAAQPRCAAAAGKMPLRQLMPAMLLTLASAELRQIALASSHYAVVLRLSCFRWYYAIMLLMLIVVTLRCRATCERRCADAAIDEEVRCAPARGMMRCGDAAPHYA